MSNKVFIIWLFIAVISSIFINHKMYGDSNITKTNYELVKDFIHIEKKKNSSKIFTDYMYERIKFYQKFDTWWERRDMFWNMYESLQKMDIT